MAFKLTLGMMLVNFACFLSSADLKFSKNSFRNTMIRVSNSLDPVGPDLGPNCLQGYQQMKPACKNFR